MRYRFRGYTLDTDTLELRGPQGEVEVEPQVFAVLAHLVSERHRVVPKEELLDTVWGDRFVSESALTTRIKQARQAVGDTGRTQEVIRTLHGRGYRLVAELVDDAGGHDDRSEAVEPATMPMSTGSGAHAPRTRYAEADGASIAYQTFGHGPDLVLVAGFGSNVEVQWEHPAIADFLHRLGRFARVTVLDKRGVGLSDRMSQDDVPPLEVRADDLMAVMDAAGIDRATVLGSSEGGSLAALFTASHPDRVERLVLHNTWLEGPALFRSIERDIETITRHWGDGFVYSVLGPSLATDDAGRRFLARMERQSATPRVARHLMELMARLDLTAALPAIAVPTLVLHRRDDAIVPLEQGRRLASGIPDARLVELEGADHYLFAGDPGETLDVIERFLTGTRAAPVPDRVLATVLFMDVVDSTVAARQMGDAAWSEVLDRLERSAGDAVSAHRGTVVKSTGDGLLATFDAPGRAVQAGLALCGCARSLGIEVRIGLHTAEIQRRGADISGIGVHIASRVADLAGPGEVWVSRTVTDLVAGTGLRFTAQGSHQLKGLDHPWQLFAAVP